MSEYRTKKIILPGGREIEVVYLGELRSGALAEGEWFDVPDADIEEALGAALADLSGVRCELWMCDRCGSELVRPLALEECEGVWRVERECPECGAHDDGFFSRDEVEQYHDALEEGTEELMTALRQIARLNMEEDVERMIDALRADRIEPMDF